MSRLLRHLLLALALLLSLGAHGAAMAQGGQKQAAPALQAHAMHHGDSACAGSHHCPPTGQPAPCCVVGHCLLGVMADAAPPLAVVRPALPEAAYFVAAFAVAPGAPERPPQAA